MSTHALTEAFEKVAAASDAYYALGSEAAEADIDAANERFVSAVENYGRVRNLLPGEKDEH